MEDNITKEGLLLLFGVCEGILWGATVLIPDKLPGYLLLLVSTVGFIVEMLRRKYNLFYKCGAIFLVVFMSLGIVYKSLSEKIEHPAHEELNKEGLDLIMKLTNENKMLNIRLLTLLPKPKYVVSEKQLHELTNAMKNFSGFHIQALVLNYTQESYIYSEKIISAIKDAGMIVNEITGEKIGGPPPSGISLSINLKDKEQVDIAEALAKALMKSGIVKTKKMSAINSGSNILQIQIAP